MNLPHLRARLMDSGYLTKDCVCSLDEIKKMLWNRFDSIDYAQAKRDVVPFIRDTASLDVWNADFFQQLTAGLTEA